LANNGPVHSYDYARRSGVRGRLNLTDLYPTNVGIGHTHANELVATTSDWSLTTHVVCAAE